MSKRGARVAARRLKACPTCKAQGTEMHHPACPFRKKELEFQVREEDVSYCSCGERWTVFHNCEAAKK